MNVTRATMFAGGFRGPGCAVVAFVFSAFTAPGAWAQDVFSAEAGYSRNSGKTGTQGVEGNPFCPPPVIVIKGVATTPRNWSCRGDAQSYRPTPHTPPPVAQNYRKPPMPIGQEAPGHDAAYHCTRRDTMPVGIIGTGRDLEYQCIRREPMPDGIIGTGYDSTYQCTRKEPMPAGMIGTGFDTAYQCTRTISTREVRTVPGLGFSVQINR
jgi:hypothetical protein